MVVIFYINKQKHFYIKKKTGEKLKRVNGGKGAYM